MTFHPEALLAEQVAVLSGSARISQKWGAYLAGGAALGLHLGHRRSEDLDWFTKKTIAPTELLSDLKTLGLPIQVRQNDQGTFLGHVGTVDYSIFRYPYGLVARPITFEGCALASLKDIAAMKMTAIVQRSTKRDYVDLHAIFETGGVPLRDVVATMRRKFPKLDPSLAIRALTYFEDVDQQPMPHMLAKTSWQDVKDGLLKVVERGLEPRGRGR